jgi:hypothetical protein
MYLHFSGKLACAALRHCKAKWRIIPQGTSLQRAWGLVPKQYSTRSKAKLYGFSKRVILIAPGSQAHAQIVHASGLLFSFEVATIKLT